MNPIRWTMWAVLTLTLVPWTMAQDVPFTGIVVDDAVPVRAGAGKAYYLVGELKRGDLVEVEEVLFGWNRIEPPAGVLSYISKAFVDVHGNGRSGVVNADGAKVKAGSINGPGESYRVQLTLDKGNTVTIVDEEGSYYKITPPAKASVFIAPGTVRRASAMEAAQEATPSSDPAPTTPPAPPAVKPQPVVKPQPKPQVQPKPQPKPADPPTVKPMPQPVVKAPVAPAPKPTPAPAQTDDPPAVVLEKGLSVDSPAVSPQLRHMEAKMMPQFMMPVEDQPIDQMIVAYETLASDPTLPKVDRQIIAMRLASLNRNKQLAQAIQQIAQVKQVPDEATIENTQAVALDAPRHRPYDAVGRLMASRVYNGSNLPLMYRLVDPTTGRTLAYVQPGQGVEGIATLGRIVGLVGSTLYDPALKLRVMQVSHIDVLSANP